MVVAYDGGGTQEHDVDMKLSLIWWSWFRSLDCS